MWTRERVLGASDAWQWVPPGAEQLHIDDVVVIDYPEWARMGFYAMPTRVAAPQRAVTAVCEAARRRGHLSTEWWVTPSTSPALEGALIKRGAVASDAADILAYDMSGGIPPVPVPNDVHAVVVTNAQSLDEAESVAAAVWGGEPSSADRREDQLRSLGDPLDEQGGFRVVAYAGRMAFATAGCQVVDGVARLYGGCVLPEMRGRGGYRQTLLKRLEVAHDHGARLALVHARVNTSKPILTQLGFTSYGEGRLYTLTA
jgi:GNAT superfamily N-acetyltransferase